MDEFEVRDQGFVFAVLVTVKQRIKGLRVFQFDVVQLVHERVFVGVGVGFLSARQSYHNEDRADMAVKGIACVQFEFVKMYSIWGPEIDGGLESGVRFEEAFTNALGVGAAQLFARSDFYAGGFDVSIGGSDIAVRSVLTLL